MAAKFIAFLYTPEAAEAMIKKAESQGRMYIPPVIEFVKMLNIPAERSQVLAEQLKEAYGPPNCPGWEEKNSEVTSQIQEVVFKNADPKAAVEKMAEALNAGLKK
jgi:multiple sugar transport system substrate-binding protein